MSHSQALSLHPDVSRRFVHDAKDDLEGLASTDSLSGASHDPYASHRHALDLESENDEETTRHATSDGHAAPLRIVSPGEPTLGLTGLDRTLGPRVRFRSRVRISAGMGRWRGHSAGLSSDASSVSSSPSSSISAPLRTHHMGKNGWGPLGSRVNPLKSQAAPLPPPTRVEYTSGGKGNGNGNTRTRYAPLQALLPVDDDVDEHTHLMTSAAQHSYIGSRRAHDSHHDDGEQERWWREQLMNEIFGKWPGRLFNGRWWWWHLEPILCCLCDPDEEQE